MRELNRVLLATMALLLGGNIALAQGTGGSKTYNKDGLVFEYPSNWVLQDQSNADAQQFALGRPDTDGQIRIFVFRPLVKTADNAAEAKRVLVDPYVNATAKQFEQMGAKPERASAKTEIGSQQAEGVKLLARLSGEPGAAEIYWNIIGQRLVVLTVFGPERARKQFTGAWDSVRNSLKIEEVKPAATPTPKD
ncbi:MAG TPA: hypothetical protein VJ023_18140 [Pyrinomonadaceae bacterium]|nr:hypothetical protein [Pyrinomonadaceae bacterium]